ncbi:MAG: hypothetical protein BV457_06175 [Thermoplasmata archaeon M9B1D]|nr:MAG: hypothetical protein BV457_06175 [Thermoplasmata archaeon M9B1D]PNX48079.1 MAG: hypothetical protein BV456_10165 [Thermoplasmata archaeon M8B2D]
MATKMSYFKFQKKSVKNKLPFRAFAGLGTILLFIGIFAFWYGNYYEKQSILYIEILIDDLVLVGYICIILAVIFILIDLIFISRQSTKTEVNYDDARVILDKRYVTGEISIEEYEQMKKDIES